LRCHRSINLRSPGRDFDPDGGLSIIEAAGMEDAIALMLDTSCTQAGGMVELRPIISGNGRYRPSRSVLKQL
jgi:hypothetical protein